ncbi:MAG: hypothetical protein K2N15_14735 [Lachnospiraceae bacterium]|nr:hypothetical protein [Lachnospiraceae bacterium]
MFYDQCVNYPLVQEQPELGEGELFTRNKTPYFLAKGKGFAVVFTMYSYYNIRNADNG